MTSDDPELRAWMQRIEGHLETIARATATGRPKGKLATWQVNALQVLLPALIEEWVPGVTFTVCGAMEHIAGRPDILAAVLRGEEVEANAASKRLGKLLAAAATKGVVVCGLRVERGAKNSQGVNWFVSRLKVEA